MIGPISQEQIYCVSDNAATQLRFVCVDCQQKNVTDILNVLNNAQDMSSSAGFPTLALKNIPLNANWTGVTIMCQAMLNGHMVDSTPAVVEVRYLRQPRVLDANGQAAVQIANQGNRFYVECVRSSDGQCQQNGQRKTLRCGVESHPPATSFRWLKNGAPIAGAGAELAVGPESIGQSVQCSANNGLYSDQDMPTSQAVQIDPYTSARLLMDNFQKVQSEAPFLSGNRIEINQQVRLGCQVEGNPRPVVFWRLRRTSGEVVNADCAQGYEGQYEEVTTDQQTGMAIKNVVRLNAVCNLRVQNYSYTGSYWCSACSYVSQGVPECSPSLASPGPSSLIMNVQGAPMESDASPTVVQDALGRAAVVTVHYCAEPAPRPPREILFMVDSNELQVGQTWENFMFEASLQNNTFPKCYYARLRIDPVNGVDQGRSISLKLQNQFGTMQIPVELGQLMGNAGMSTGGLSGWWIAFIVLVLIALIAGVVVFLCFVRRMCCFDGRANWTSQKQQKDTSSTKYSSNLAPQHFSSEPAAPPRQTYLPNYQQAPPVPEKRAHEGLNYAELDLTDRNGPPTTDAFSPTEYVRLQQAPHAALGSHTSSINSIV
uniref:Ig-like domain-containing protein n=1 Tax=Plectus sambesii TaxID=2011161 RepID=A0A914XPC6_9BILA